MTIDSASLDHYLGFTKEQLEIAQDAAAAKAREGVRDSLLRQFILRAEACGGFRLIPAAEEVHKAIAYGQDVRKVLSEVFGLDAVFVPARSDSPYRDYDLGKYQYVLPVEALMGGVTNSHDREVIQGKVARAERIGRKGFAVADGTAAVTHGGATAEASRDVSQTRGQ